MFPIRDDQPSFTKPFVNYLIIGLNVLVFLFEQWVGLQSPRAYLAFIYEFGIVPRHVTHALGGAGDFSIAAATWLAVDGLYPFLVRWRRLACVVLRYGVLMKLLAGGATIGETGVGGG